jgi:Flp pilus assembly protein TadD
MQLGSYGLAVDALKKVIELEPNNFSGHNDLGAAYFQMGRFEESVAEFKRAIDLQPAPVPYMNLGIAYAFGGNYADAIPMYEKAVELDPNGELYVGSLGDGYRWGGRATQAAAAYDKAIALALKDLQVNPQNALTRGNVALYYAKKGDDARARRMMASARAIDRANVNLIYAAAVIEVFGGRPAEALTTLEEALKAGYPFSAAANDPDIRPLLGEPRFKELAGKFNP